MSEKRDHRALCPKCGAKRVGNAIVCLKCGDETAFEPPALLECPACRREISRNALACPHCGEPLRKPEEKQSATGLLAAIIIALLIGGILYSIIVGMH